LILANATSLVRHGRSWLVGDLAAAESYPLKLKADR